MTNTNLVRAMGRIDPKLIAEAAPDVPQKKSANRTGVKWASLAACFALIVGTIIGVPMLFTNGDAVQLPTDIDNIIWDTGTGDEVSNDVEIPLWEEWCVDSYILYRELENAAPEQYFALHISKIFWDGFVYNGKSVAEILSEKDEKYILIEKLGQLVKDGHVLKYGDLVYTLGTPEGEKWAKSLYDERLEYYGKEFLSKYIVDGEFYQSQAEVDLSNAIAEAEQLEILYDKSYKAYHNSYVDDIEEIFSNLGVCTAVKNNKLFVFIQKEKLATLEIADKGSYRLSLAKRRNYEHEEGDIPTFENNVTGFALEKIKCETFDHYLEFAKSDAELIDKINALIEAGQFDTDRIIIWITSSEDLSQDIFRDMNYESLHITRKYKTSALAWMYVKYENINLEVLKAISNIESIKSIRIYIESTGPDIAG